jgi:tRNA A-37 threonylcarbamoyl transferase component Bud32
VPLTDHLAPGRVIERHVVEAAVGEGGMAVVYRVRHAQLGTAAALKLLTITHSAVRERFLQEGRVQATLRHANIVAVTDLLEVDGHPALMMEFVDGPTLHDWLAEKRPLAVGEAVFRGIVAGVAKAHELGLVHRDLKPANVLIATIDGQPVPKVADFGLAKLVESATPDSGHTRSGTTMGTPAYMAPEQIRDAKHVDSRADLFSLGCILYEIVTGEIAFVGEDLLELLTNVSRGTHVPARERVPDLPDRIVAAIEGCLTVDVDARIPDCATLLAVLDGKKPWGPAAKTPKPTAAVPARPVARASTGVSLGAATIAAAALVSVGILGGGVLVGGGLLWWLNGDPKPSQAADSDVAEVEAEPETVAITTACEADDGVTIGWLNHRALLFKRRGATWTLPSDKTVWKRRPTAEDPTVPAEADAVCALPRGTRLKLTEAPVPFGMTGNWIEVVGGGWELPK